MGAAVWADARARMGMRWTGLGLAFGSLHGLLARGLLRGRGLLVKFGPRGVLRPAGVAAPVLEDTRTSVTSSLRMLSASVWLPAERMAPSLKEDFVGGFFVGAVVVGAIVGFFVVGRSVGAFVGAVVVGLCVGLFVGLADGFVVGVLVVGLAEGLAVGRAVCLHVWPLWPLLQPAVHM